MLKYNITIDPVNIDKFIETPGDYEYLEPQNSLQDLKWENTIKTLSDLNSLHVIFFETWKGKSKSNTKKVYIHNSSKRTKRKRLKI